MGGMTDFEGTRWHSGFETTGSRDNTSAVVLLKPEPVLRYIRTRRYGEPVSRSTVLVLLARYCPRRLIVSRIDVAREETVHTGSLGKNFRTFRKGPFLVASFLCTASLKAAALELTCVAVALEWGSHFLVGELALALVLPCY
jgi:hypothetical protein